MRGSIIPLALLMACAPSGQVTEPGGGHVVAVPGGDEAEDAPYHEIEDTYYGVDERVAAPVLLDGEPIRQMELVWYSEAWLSSLDGLSLNADGSKAMAGMGSLSCTLNTENGNIEDDRSIFDGDEEPDEWWDDEDDWEDEWEDDDEDDEDWDDEEEDERENILLLRSPSTGEVGLFDGTQSFLYSTPNVVDAQMDSTGIVALAESDLGCQLMHIALDGTRIDTELPAEACGAEMDIDKTSDTVWLANGDLWSVRDGIAVLEAEDVGDKVTFDYTTGHVVTAYKGGTTVTAHGAWTYESEHGVRSLRHMGDSSAILLVTSGDTGSRLIALDSGDGYQVMDQAAPGLEAQITVSRDGTMVGLDLDNNQAIFYRVSVR